MGVPPYPRTGCLFLPQPVLNLRSQRRISKQQLNQHPHDLSLRDPSADAPLALGSPASKLVIEVR
jgi:hypothetical protein